MILRIPIGILIFIIIAAIFVFLYSLGIVKLEVIAALIMGILIGKVDTIGKYIFSKNKGKSERIITSPLQKDEFNAEIVHHKRYYYRGQDRISFKSRYRGKLRNGYFVNSS